MLSLSYEDKFLEFTVSLTTVSGSELSSLLLDHLASPDLVLVNNHLKEAAQTSHVSLHLGSMASNLILAPDGTVLLKYLVVGLFRVQLQGNALLLRSDGLLVGIQVPTLLVLQLLYLMVRHQQ